MDLGTGIFLSSLFLGIIALYAITKDRWNWRRFGRWTRNGVLVLLALGILFGAGAYVWSQFPMQASAQTRYADLSLGLDRKEVLYLKGTPPFVYAEIKDNLQFAGFQYVIAAKDIPKEKGFDHYDDWSYALNRHHIEVTFDPTTGRLVKIGCRSQDTYQCPSLLNIYDGTSEDDVISKLGKPTHSRIYGTSKRMTYESFRVYFFLTKAKVTSFGVYSGDYRWGAN